jgi:peptidoglycan/xylan/chitin deacetylase (PgdA/CDA1 family)
MPARQLLKTAVEQGLLRSGLPRISTRLRRSHALVLAYHDVVPEGERPTGDSSLHLPRAAFSEQLDALLQVAEVVPLDAALSAGTAWSGRPRVAITFDDAYRGAVLAGVSELVKRGLPATIFGPPALLNDGIFWWDALTPDGVAGLAPEVRDDALWRMAGKGSEILEHHGCTDSSRIPGWARGATESELLDAARQPGITLASHSWSHPNLAALSPDELEGELTRPLAWLRERFTDVLPYISYPYGHYSAAVERAAAEAGYAAAFRIDGGWLREGDASRYALPRLNIPAGLSNAGFRLRVSGLLA